MMDALAAVKACLDAAMSLVVSGWGVFVLDQFLLLANGSGPPTGSSSELKLNPTVESKQVCA